MNHKDPSDSSNSETEDLTSTEPWCCDQCDHVEEQSVVRCSSCRYFRLSLNLLQPIEIAPIQSSKRSSTKHNDDEALELAADKLQSLFNRAQSEGESLNDRDRADLYHALLTSFFKIERTSIRRAVLREMFTQERDAQRKTHMIHLSVIWFLGICTGFALYFGLEAVSKL